MKEKDIKQNDDGCVVKKEKEKRRKEKAMTVGLDLEKSK